MVIHSSLVGTGLTSVAASSSSSPSIDMPANRTKTPLLFYHANAKRLRSLHNTVTHRSSSPCDLLHCAASCIERNSACGTSTAYFISGTYRYIPKDNIFQFSRITNLKSLLFLLEFNLVIHSFSLQNTVD